MPRLEMKPDPSVITDRIKHLIYCNNSACNRGAHKALLYFYEHWLLDTMKFWNEEMFSLVLQVHVLIKSSLISWGFFSFINFTKSNVRMNVNELERMWQETLMVFCNSLCETKGSNEKFKPG
jgi:hypothetical protein